MLRISSIVPAVVLLASTAVDTALVAQDGPPLLAETATTSVSTYRVGPISIDYHTSRQGHPDLQAVRARPLTLGRIGDTWHVASLGIEPVTRTIGQWMDAPADQWSASAIQALLESIRDFAVESDLIGAWVAPDPADIAPDGKDLRAAGDESLHIIITTGTLEEVRTVAGGERVREGGEIEPDDRINHPLHARLLAESPVKPAQDGAPVTDLLRRSELERYVYFLSRHPGRYVDISLAPGTEPGGTTLDYRVTENRPFVLYGQVSNTGTRTTDYWRQRVGFLHTQLTNADDILSVDFTTAAFDEMNALLASYERPLDNERVRWKAYGQWLEYTASDVGGLDDLFTGNSWQLGGEIAWNFHQDRSLFVDLVAGIRFDDIEVDNRFIGLQGAEQFLTPYVGLRAERASEWYAFSASAMLEWQGDLLSADESEVERLGRTDPDESWTVFKWDATHAFYLEPLLDAEDWSDPQGSGTRLAHEIQLAFRGQAAMGNRLIPQAQRVAGGLYTVRGYPESVAAGDTTALASLEYRFHVPRALTVEPEPRELFGEPFRFAPQYVFGLPDWDLVLKGFVDAGKVWVSDPFSFEEDEELIGAGIGLDFIYRRNVNLRLDWGFVLNELEDRDVNSGSNRLHVVFTILF